jgi:hypothetical protein
MTQDEIIEMAKEADIKYRTDVFYSQFCDGVYEDELKAFAKLVAAKEREACAKLCDEYGDEYGEFIADVIRSRGQA